MFRMIQKLSNYGCVAGMFTLLIMMILTTCDVIGRNFFRAPIIGSFELTEFMLVVVVLLSIPYTQQVGGNARITMFVSRLGPRGQLMIDALMSLLSLIFFLIIARGAWAETVHALHSGGVSDMLRIPKWPFNLLLTVGIFFLSLELFIGMIKSIGKFLNYSAEGRS